MSAPPRGMGVTQLAIWVGPEVQMGLSWDPRSAVRGQSLPNYYGTATSTRPGRSRPTGDLPMPRAPITRTQAPFGSRLRNLLSSFGPICTSDQTDSSRCAVKTVPGGGNDVSE